MLAQIFSSNALKYADQESSRAWLAGWMPRRKAKASEEEIRDNRDGGI